MRSGKIPVTSHYSYDRASHDHAVGDLRDLRGLLRSIDSEADCCGNIRRLADR